MTTHGKASFWQRFKHELTLLTCIIGIYVIYIYYAVLQERITCTPFGEDKERFTFIFSLLFIQTIANSIASGFGIMVSTERRFYKKETLPYFVLLAFTYLGGMYSSYAALDYVNFPTTVLVKSCKMIPVMIMGWFIQRRKYSLHEWICMIMVSAGIGGFMYLKGGSDSKANSAIGLVLTIVSLSMDGATGAIQDHIRGMKISTHQMMFGINTWSILWLSIALIATGEGAQAVDFTIRHPEILNDLLIFCVVSAVGQNFIFLAISVAGALTCSIITTTRKFFTILLSVIWFGHPLAWSQWASVGLVFIGLGWDIQHKYSKKERSKQQ
eukprot:TRINITY_DN3107_c1_g1_i1.p1 TRINITY_DN3107_c1_g1~~TRINITY_DN3107_c1_g1_i1.p1  ORF type:complete len:326 (-),score=68.71 TRINITY_DN3107_c1_g1_i1:43-1020(-)